MPSSNPVTLAADHTEHSEILKSRLLRTLRLISACVLFVTGVTPIAIAQAPPKQAVIETSFGTVIIDLVPEEAPNQVDYFIQTAQQGGYDGTVFHRAIKYGMVQGGDPLSKDPSKRSQYGTGGLNAVKDEAHAPKMTRGSVAAIMVP